MPLQCWLPLGGQSAATAALSLPVSSLAWPGLPCPAKGHHSPTAAAAAAACSSFPLQQSPLYCNHTIIMPLKCHIHRNPHKQGISSCQEIVVLLLMTHFPPAAPLVFFLNIIFPFFVSLVVFFLFCFVSEL